MFTYISLNLYSHTHTNKRTHTYAKSVLIKILCQSNFAKRQRLSVFQVILTLSLYMYVCICLCVCVRYIGSNTIQQAGIIGIFSLLWESDWRLQGVWLHIKELAGAELVLATRLLCHYR